MKIIAVDNFNRETIADRLVCSGIKYETEGKMMLEALQASCSSNGATWYRLVEDDYRLSRGMADIVGEPEELAAEEALEKCSKRAQQVMKRLIAGEFYPVYDSRGLAGPKAMQELVAAGLVVQGGRVMEVGRFYVPYGASEFTVEKFPPHPRRNPRHKEASGS